MAVLPAPDGPYLGPLDGETEEQARLRQRRATPGGTTASQYAPIRERRRGSIFSRSSLAGGSISSPMPEAQPAMNLEDVLGTGFAEPSSWLKTPAHYLALLKVRVRARARACVVS